MNIYGISRGAISLIWIYLLTFFTCLENVNSSWWLLGRSHMSSVHLDMQCSNLPGLTKQQRTICLKKPKFMPFISRGVRMGVSECQQQLKDRRWNCSTVANGSSVFGKVTERIGSRETAFVYAISSASAVYSLAKACSAGDLTACRCDKVKSGHFNDTEGDFSWQGCGSFIKYSVKFAKRFIDAREGDTKDSRALMNLHNNSVGRRVVRKLTKKICKCHGVSGTCTVRTCWKSLRPFSEIGAFLKERYDGAVQVTLQQKGAITTDKDTKPFTKFDLVYFEPSPDYCTADKTIGIVGTAGRECKKNSKGPDNCDVLCCGNGYDTKRVTLVTKCNCKFHYCCYVTCDECHETKDIYTCKSINNLRRAGHPYG